MIQIRYCPEENIWVDIDNHEVEAETICDELTALRAEVERLALINENAIHRLRVVYGHQCVGQQMSQIDVQALRLFLEMPEIGGRRFADDQTQLKKDAEAGQRSCPCLYGDPCSDNCSCANKGMSGGCERCCAYGSDEQRAGMAKRIIGDLEAGRRLPMTADGVRVVPWVDENLVTIKGNRAAWYTDHLTDTMTGDIVSISECYSTLEAMRAGEGEKSTE